MGFMACADGAQIYYKDWGSGPPIVFSHSWPVDADAWDAQVLFLLRQGYRVVAHDRRGHGRSSQVDSGHNLDRYADDLAQLIDMLQLQGAALVGHGSGGGEVARYIARHGTRQVARAVLVSPMAPLPRQTDGMQPPMFDAWRTALAGNRAQFWRDLALPFYGFNRVGTTAQSAVVDAFCHSALRGSVQAQFDGIRLLSESDGSDDLRKFNVPTLFVHGDDDQIAPLATSSARACKLVKNSTLKVFEGGAHGICSTQAERLNAEILSFLAD